MRNKNIEERIQKIIHDCNFKLRKGFEVEDTINTLKYIIIEIAKSNDALRKIAFMKGYYSELFEDSRTLYFVYQTNCNKLDRLIENYNEIPITIGRKILETENIIKFIPDDKETKVG